MRRLGFLLLTVLLLTGACTAVAKPALSVLASWTGDEEKAFKAVLRGFTEETGIEVTYTGTRALSQVLRSDVQKGQPPDVAVLPSPGELATYVRTGDVQPIDGVLGPHPEESYSEQWLQLQRAGTGNLYVVPVKTDLKSIIWHEPAVSRAPESWDELRRLADEIQATGHAPWCVGMGAPPASGWPGTDWIEDILLHQAGPEVYGRWASGTLEWTSPAVRQAWTTWGALVTKPGAIDGGPAAALLTDFDDARRPMFADRPECSLEHLASFALVGYRSITKAGKPLVPGQDFDYFAFPGADASEVSADLAAMFRSSDGARRLLSYLASEKAQRIWPSFGNAFSANKKVDVYADPVSKRIAKTLTSASTLCFDASDLMPAQMSSAFFRAVLTYLADPEQLDPVLRDLELIRKGTESNRLEVPCGRRTTG
ncbi:ABC transporter substrate-binding protein [Amycolatopsis sp. cg5]|uniref:ABC transporter substrate-binding protein n=1 Tax=Amycolatopsis sp. cg5 TaxID=3238802 RepID=UPI0035247D3F